MPPGHRAGRRGGARGAPRVPAGRVAAAPADRRAAARCTPPPLGKCLLAFAPVAAPPPDELDLQPYTGRTPVDRRPRSPSTSRLRASRGWAGEHGRVRAGRGRGRRAGPGERRAGRAARWASTGRSSELFDGRTAAARRRRLRGRSCARAACSGDLGATRSLVERVAVSRDGSSRRIDQGTTSTRCLLFNQAGPDARGRAARAPPALPAARAGSSTTPTEIWRNVTRIVPAALRSAGLHPEQRRRRSGSPTSARRRVIWNRHTGVPLARAITWQDTRTDGIVARLVERRQRERWSPSVCGLPLATYFAGPDCAGRSAIRVDGLRELGPSAARCSSAPWTAG